MKWFKKCPNRLEMGEIESNWGRRDSKQIQTRLWVCNEKIRHHNSSQKICSCYTKASLSGQNKDGGGISDWEKSAVSGAGGCTEERGRSHENEGKKQRRGWGCRKKAHGTFLFHPSFHPLFFYHSSPSPELSWKAQPRVYSPLKSITACFCSASQRGVWGKPEKKRQQKKQTPSRSPLSRLCFDRWKIGGYSLDGITGCWVKAKNSCLQLLIMISSNTVGALTKHTHTHNVGHLSCLRLYYSVSVISTVHPKSEQISHM